MKFLELVNRGLIKARVMFTQNIHATDHIQYEEQDAKFFKLYYQFIKHAFGLMFCNPDGTDMVRVAVYLDKAPDTAAALNNFKDYLASLTVLPEFFEAKVIVDKDTVAEINSKEHVILQAVDVILGAIQFRLNELKSPSERQKTTRQTDASERTSLQGDQLTTAEDVSAFQHRRHDWPS